MSTDASDPATFVSYCRVDSEFSLRLAADLKAHGADVWLDQLDIVPGQRWDGAIERALTDSSRLLVILSPAAVSSTNVMDEVSFGLDEGKTIIPIVYQECTVPFRLRRLQHVDFRHDYEHGLKDLLRTLIRQETPVRTAPVDLPSYLEDDKANGPGAVAGRDARDLTRAEPQQHPLDEDHERDNASPKAAMQRASDPSPGQRRENDKPEPGRSQQFAVDPPYRFGKAALAVAGVSTALAVLIYSSNWRSTDRGNVKDAPVQPRAEQAAVRILDSPKSAQQNSPFENSVVSRSVPEKPKAEKGVTTGGISGRVFDSTCADLSDAQVTLLSPEPTPSEKTVQADDKGRFSFPNLQPGRYLVKPTVQSFDYYSEIVTVEPGRTKHVTILMHIVGTQPPTWGCVVRADGSVVMK